MKKTPCIICGKTGDDGLHLMGNTICVQCEGSIMTTDVADVQYDAFVKKLLHVARKLV